MKLIKQGKIENSKNIIASYKGHFKLGKCFNLFYKFCKITHNKNERREIYEP